MNPFRKILRVVTGKDAIPPALADAMAADPVLAAAVSGAIEEAAQAAPNWQAIIGLILQLLPVILPLL